MGKFKETIIKQTISNPEDIDVRSILEIVVRDLLQKQNKIMAIIEEKYYSDTKKPAIYLYLDNYNLNNKTLLVWSYLENNKIVIKGNYPQYKIEAGCETIEDIENSIIKVLRHPSTRKALEEIDYNFGEEE